MKRDFSSKFKVLRSENRRAITVTSRYRYCFVLSSTLRRKSQANKVFESFPDSTFLLIDVSLIRIVAFCEADTLVQTFYLLGFSASTCNVHSACERPIKGTAARGRILARECLLPSADGRCPSYCGFSGPCREKSREESR